MFKKISFIFALIMIISTSYAQDLNKYDYIKVGIENTVEFDMEFENSYDINVLTLDNQFYPKTYNNSQYLNEFTTSNENYQIIETIDSAHFRYDLSDNAQEKNIIQNNFIIQSTVDRPKINSVVPFPNTITNSQYDEFLEFEGLITIDEDIRRQATTLAQGETDTFVIAAKVAKWIREDIEYDLSTVTENPDQTSSQVFQSKEGVCKEITHLYISMMRSLGIPARVVTGYAYTTSESVIDFVGSPWGGHAWAEVYIDGQWVPFDLTYNQYGFVDATHIVLDKSASIRDNSITINGSGRGFSLVQGSLISDTQFEVLDKREELFDPGFELKLDGPQELGPGSYGYINATITNNQPFYQVLFLQIAKTKEIELISKPEQMMIFKPQETKELLLTYKVPQVDENYIYTFPFSLYNEFLKEEFLLKVERNKLVLTKDELPVLEKTQVSFSQNDVSLSCKGAFSPIKNQITCTIINPNNYEIENSKICIQEDCQTHSILINEQKNIVFTTSNFKETIIFSQQDNLIIQDIEIQKPKMISDIEIEGNKVNLEASHNKGNDLEIQIIVNNEIIQSYKKTDIEFSKEFEPGDYKLDLVLSDGVRELQKESVEFTIDKLTIWEKITNFFKNLI